MDGNISKIVFLPGELTVEEQYKLAIRKETRVSNSNRSESKHYAAKIPGNGFFKVGSSLYEQKELFAKPLKAGFNIPNLIITSLLFTKPFYNFVNAMKNSLNEKIEDLEIMYHFCGMFEYLAIENKRIPPNTNLVDEEQEETNLFSEFDKIMRLSHEDLVKKYFFVEDVWKDPADLKIAKKFLYPEFSPIAGIFHFELLRVFGKNKSEIETLFCISIKCDERKVGEIIDFLYGKREKNTETIKKWPHVLTVKITNFGACNLCNQIKLGGRKYSFESCVFINSRKEPALIAELNGNLYEITDETVNCRSDLYFDEHLEELIVFYSAVDYDFF